MSSQEKIGSVENMYEETHVEWKITDFCKIARKGRFWYCDSPSFSFANSSWYFHVYPKSSVDPECIALYLGCLGGVLSEYSVEYTFGLKRLDNNVEHLFTGIVRKGEMFGSRNSIKRSEVMQWKCELLPADVLTITCTLKHGAIHSSQPKHEPTLKKLISK